MSWGDVRRVLVSIPSGLTPTTVGRGLVAKFRHDPQGHDDAVGTQSRRWWGRVVSGAAEGPYQTQQTRHRVMWEVVVEYVDDVGNTSHIDEAIPEDAALLARAFAHGGNWQRAQGSGIVAVTPAGLEVAPYTVEQVPGARRLRMTLEVRYSSVLAYDDVQTYDDPSYSFGGV
jgi:hypothetical protein